MDNLLFTIWVTTACNLKCKYCYEGNEKPKLYLNKVNANKCIKFILKTLNRQKVVKARIIFHGGEPSLNMEIIKYLIFELSKYENKYIFEYGITTNGYNLAKEDKEYILNHIDDITVSIDGNKESHDVERLDYAGKGCFDKVIKNAIYLNTKKIIRIRMTVTPNNVRKLSKNVIFLIESGFKVIIPGMDYAGKWNKELINILKAEITLVKSYIVGLNDVSVAMTSKEQFSKKEVCEGGHGSFHLSADGFIYPCAYTVGKLQYIIGTFNKGIDKHRLSELDIINNKDVDDCLGCTYYHYCLTKRCKFFNKELTGSYYKPSGVVCAVENILLELNY